MPRTPRLLPVARWSSAGDLLALVATAPVIDEAPEPEVVEVEPQAPPPAERTPVDDTDLPAPEGGVRWRMPIFVLEGWETSDGRYIEPGALGRRDLPQSLMAMTRNPDGGFGHDAAIVAGRIDRMERFDASQTINRETGEPYGPDVWAWSAEGWFIPTDEQPGSEATLRYVRERALRGVSVDLGEVVAEVDVLEVDDDGFEERVRLRVTQGSIAQATVCPFAAFPGAYIELVDDDEAAQPDEPPAELPAVAASALRITGDEGCAPCGTGVGLTAAGLAPERPPASWFADPGLTDPDRHVYVERHPDGTPTGRTYGYIAQWNTCHTGVGNACVTAPRNGPDGYRLFHTGAVLTAEGDEVPVGHLTFGGGHASIDRGVSAALSHYDDAGTALVDCAVGENEVGIWYAGAFRPEVTREQIDTFARHALSGDWRRDARGGPLMLVAALAVNVPGFNMRAHARVASGVPQALVAAGSGPLRVRAERLSQHHPEHDVRAAIDRALRPVLTQAARQGLARLRG